MFKRMARVLFTLELTKFIQRVDKKRGVMCLTRTSTIGRRKLRKVRTMYAPYVVKEEQTGRLTYITRLLSLVMAQIRGKTL